jgi:hypothetical protein
MKLFILSLLILSSMALNYDMNKYSNDQEITVPLINYIIKNVNSTKLYNGEDLLKLADKLAKDQYVIGLLNKGLE